MRNWRHVTGLGWGGDVNVHVNLRHIAQLTSRHWVGCGVGMLTFMLTCVTCTTDVTSLGWGGVGMLTFMLTWVTCTTDVTSLGGVGMLTFMLTCVPCTTDVTSLGWVGVGMLTFMLTCVPCTTDVTSLGWGGVGMLTFMCTLRQIQHWTTDVTSLGWCGVGMLTFMLTCVTCTTDVTSLGRGGDVNVWTRLQPSCTDATQVITCGRNWESWPRRVDAEQLARVSWKMSFAEWLMIRCDWICPTEKTIILFRRVENRWAFHTKRTSVSWPQRNYDLTFLSRFYKTLQMPWFGERSIMKNPWVTPGR